MEALEVIAKLFGLLLFYMFFFLIGGTLFCFLMLVGGIYAVCSYFGTKDQGKLVELDSGFRNEAIYAHDTIVMYKKEEYPATIMYEVVNSEFDILSITNAQEDFTETLPPEEISRLLVELEYSHVD